MHLRLYAVLGRIIFLSWKHATSNLGAEVVFSLSLPPTITLQAAAWQTLHNSHVAHKLQSAAEPLGLNSHGMALGLSTPLAKNLAARPGHLIGTSPNWCPICIKDEACRPHLHGLLYSVELLMPLHARRKCRLGVSSTNRRSVSAANCRSVGWLPLWRQRCDCWTLECLGHRQRTLIHLCARGRQI